MKEKDKHSGFKTPEGYFEGFATIYREIAEAIRAARGGSSPDASIMFPTGEDGEKGVAFVEAVVRSSDAGGTWIKL